MRIELIVTGDAERSALHRSLRRALDIVCASKAEGVTLGTPQRVDSFTSTRVITNDVQMTRRGVRPVVHKMANALVAAVVDGRRGQRADLVIAVDDLELANDDQAEVVVATFASAVRQVIEERCASGRHAARLAAELRMRASFHLLAPMLEGYFFADDGALDECSLVRQHRFDRACDVERFLTDDSDYLRTGDGEKERSWLARHPKRYLTFLSDGAYRETTAGRRALERLRWPRVVENDTHAACARALLDDLLWAVRDEGIPGRLHPSTCLRDGGTLRNIT